MIDFMKFSPVCFSFCFVFAVLFLAIIIVQCCEEITAIFKQHDCNEQDEDDEDDSEIDKKDFEKMGAADDFSEDSQEKKDSYKKKYDKQLLVEDLNKKYEDPEWAHCHQAVCDLSYAFSADEYYDITKLVYEQRKLAKEGK